VLSVGFWEDLEQKGIEGNPKVVRKLNSKPE